MDITNIRYTISLKNLQALAFNFSELHIHNKKQPIYIRYIECRDIIFIIIIIMYYILCTCLACIFVPAWIILYLYQHYKLHFLFCPWYNRRENFNFNFFLHYIELLSCLLQ